MTNDETQKYRYYSKMAWVIYALLVFILACVLVLFVAQDNEERFFYGFMSLAGGYVFRPTQRFFDRLIVKYTGVTQPVEKE